MSSQIFTSCTQEIPAEVWGNNTEKRNKAVKSVFQVGYHCVQHITRICQRTGVEITAVVTIVSPAFVLLASHGWETKPATEWQVFSVRFLIMGVNAPGFWRDADNTCYNEHWKYGGIVGNEWSIRR